MKSILFFTLIHFCSFALGQAGETLRVVVKKTNYEEGSVFSRDNQYDTLSVSLDSTFLSQIQKELKVFKHWPMPEFHAALRDSVVYDWHVTDSIYDINHGYCYTYRYDSSAKLTEYHYSSCIFCGMLSFDYWMQYDSKGRLIKMTNIVNSKDYYTLSWKGNRVQSIKTYNSANELVFKYSFYYE